MYKSNKLCKTFITYLKTNEKGINKNIKSEKNVIQGPGNPQKEKVIED